MLKIICKLFKKNAICPKSLEKSPTAVVETPIPQVDNKTARLMTLIGEAVEKWSMEYGLENLPKKIIWGQVFDAMCTIDLTINSSSQQVREEI